MLNKPVNPFITTNTLVFFERISFFLFINFLYQHLTSEAVRLHPNDTAELLALFVSGAVFSRIFGGLIVDFLLGTKLALIIGIGLQFLGISMLTTTNINTIYLGMIPYALGQALIMPAVLKRNSLNFAGNNHRLIAINYSTFFSIVVAAILVSFVPVSLEYGMMQSDITLTMIYSPLFLALLIAVFTKGTYGKDHQEIETLETQEQPARSGIILFTSVMALILFYFALNAINGKMSLSDNMLNNLQSLRNNEFVPSHLFWEYILICSIPALALTILGSLKRINPLLISSIGFALALIGILLYYFIVAKELNIPFLLEISMALYLIQEGFITPSLVTLIQRNTPLKYTGTLIGLCLAFSGFLSGYIAEKLFWTEGIPILGNDANYSLNAIFAGIAVFLILTVSYILLWMRSNKEQKLDRFEDVDHL